MNRLGSQGRWAFVEFKDVYMIAGDFVAAVEAHFNETTAAAALTAGVTG